MSDYYGDEKRKYSGDGRYRYLSCQRIGTSDNRLLFIMLNPASTVGTLYNPKKHRQTNKAATTSAIYWTLCNPKKHRQTRTLCINFARRWGFGLLEVVNLFALEARTPKLLRKADDPVGPDNDKWICDAVARADKVVVAWGIHGSYKNRSRDVLQMILPIRVPYYLLKTKGGEPRHPIGIPKDTQLTAWA